MKFESQPTTLKEGTAQYITADKRLRFTPPKLPSATSFIRKTLCGIMGKILNKKKGIGRYENDIIELLLIKNNYNYK